MTFTTISELLAAGIGGEKLRDYEVQKNETLDDLESQLDAEKARADRLQAELHEYAESYEKMKAERDRSRAQFAILHTVAGGSAEYECLHDPITGNVCDGCGQMLKTVRLDDIGLCATILDYQAATEQLQAKTAEVERLKETNRRISRREQSAQAALTDIVKHPDSKMHSLADHYFREGYEAAVRAELRSMGKTVPEEPRAPHPSQGGGE